MKILIADDNQRVRRSVAELLAFKPMCEVSGEASDGLEAMQKASELLPDLILLDISMPGIDGLTVARQLRTKFPKTAIVLMSQHDPELFVPLARAAGADGCLDKTHLQRDLLAIIDRISHDSSTNDRNQDPPGPDVVLRKPA